MTIKKKRSAVLTDRGEEASPCVYLHAKLLTLLGRARGTFLHSLLHWPSRTAPQWNQCVCVFLWARVCPPRGGEVWRPGHSHYGALRRERGRQLFNLATQRTQKERETGRMYDMRRVLNHPALTPPYFSHHEPVYTQSDRVVWGMPWLSEEDNEMSANFSGVMDWYE